MLFQTLIGLLLLLIPILSLRLISVLPGRRAPAKRRTPGKPTRLLIILGSGGHTAEMLSILRNLDTRKYTHRSYVISSGDEFSKGHALSFEEQLRKRVAEGDHDHLDIKDANGVDIGQNAIYGSYDIVSIPRARYIHQSLLTTPFTSLQCLGACFKVLQRPTVAGDGHYLGYPDLIISNGPGTGVIVVLASLILRFLALPGTADKMRTIYVESWARVKSLSLSGKLLLPVVDRFVVQWETLRKIIGPQVEFRNVIA